MEDIQAQTVYVDPDMLRRQAQAWADSVREKTGARIAQPISAYVRFLLEREEKQQE